MCCNHSPDTDKERATSSIFNLGLDSSGTVWISISVACTMIHTHIWFGGTGKWVRILANMFRDSLSARPLLWQERLHLGSTRCTREVDEICIVADQEGLQTCFHHFQTL